MPELVDLLEDPVITLYYLGERPEELISAVQLPGKRFGVWTGEVEARATLACEGEWVIFARATVAGSRSRPPSERIFIHWMNKKPY